MQYIGSRRSEDTVEGTGLTSKACDWAMEATKEYWQKLVLPFVHGHEVFGRNGLKQEIMILQLKTARSHLSRPTKTHARRAESAGIS